MKKIIYILLLLFLSQVLPAQDSVRYVNQLNAQAMKSKDSCLFFATKAWEISTRLNYRKGKSEALKAAVKGDVLFALLKDSRQVNYLDYFIQGEALKEWKLSNQLQQEKIAKANMLKQQRLILISFLAGIVLILGGFTFIRYRSYRNLRQQELMLKGMNAVISEKNKQLQTNDDFKNKLISVIAHDFRAPLDNIIRVAEMFRKDGDQAALQETIAQVDASSRNTLVIFDNILRWIKSQLSGFVYTPSPCNLRVIFGDVVESMNTEVTLQIPEKLTVAGEYEMLQFVNRSLMICSGETIVVTAVREAERVKVIISSMKPDVADAAGLFEKDISLSLLICKDFMAKMGGQIWAEKHGATLQFIYALPSFH
jgi:signal transduction histidine kinase